MNRFQQATPTPGDHSAATLDDVRAAYRLLLGRTPRADELEYFRDLLARDTPTPVTLAQHFLDAPEFTAQHGALAMLDAHADFHPDTRPLCCEACTRARIESPAFLYWALRLGERPGMLHRKLWEWCFITHALDERGMFAAGRRGLGFAVGNEPLTALFARMGCSIVASDVNEGVAREGGWLDTDQHANDAPQLNRRGLCPPDAFARRVQFREVDMRAIPDDLRGFDFLWSSCALEHLGSLQAGVDYVMAAMDCLKPGGVAVHTTEFNCDSDAATTETGPAVVYRRRDLLSLAEHLRAAGHHVAPFDFDLGASPADGIVQEPPFEGMPQLKLRLGPYASTSFGLVIRNGAA